jgi:LysR family transcriptional regulator of abg operon
MSVCPRHRLSRAVLLLNPLLCKNVRHHVRHNDALKVITVQLTQMRNLLAAVDSGSIRGAARELRISQPALTRSIRQLETELRVKLLERTVRGVVPTPAGRAFLARSRMVHNELVRAREELAQLAGEHAGSVAFGVSPPAAIHIVPPALAQFRREYVNTDVRIVDGLSHLLLPQLREGSLDFFIGVRPQSPLNAQIKVQPLFTNRLVSCARRGHPLRNARSLADLVDAKWVIYTPAVGWGTIIPDLFEKHRLPPPKSVVRSDSYIALLTVLAGTDMIGALSHMLFDQQLVRGFFEPFDLKERFPEFTHCLFVRTDSPLTPVAAAMVAAVKAAARRLAFRSSK